jgi:LysR family glycine cleavage system transcriptional activator
MPPPLPSLNGLRAFEAAARHLSFTRAATELNVTQTAISHQIRRLEEQLGTRLFVPRGAELSAGGPCGLR